MMSNKTKTLFFDIDGTLLSGKTGEVPEGAKQAVEEARSKGHLALINIGGVYPHIWQIRLEIEVDGCLYECGTYVPAKGRVLYYYHTPREHDIHTKRDVDEYGLDGTLEGADDCYFHGTTSRMPRVEELKAALRGAGHAGRYDWEDDCYNLSKFYPASNGSSRCMELFRRPKNMEVTDRGDGYYECVPRGHSKATAIDRVLKHYSISRDNAYVFGSNSNDLSMSQYATNRVFAGQHSEALVPHATFETRDAGENGITYAMKELGIV